MAMTNTTTSGQSLQVKPRGRYHALEISDAWDLKWIRSVRALVVGAGALGNEVTKNLAMMGVREIIIVDFDDVEVSNLTRSVFFRDEDSGDPKAEVLAERLRTLNPDVRVTSLQGKLKDVVGLGLLRNMDMVFSCLDSKVARVELNEACQLAGVPWVNGGMENLLGEVSVFLPDEGPCYECLLSEPARKELNRSRSCLQVAREAVAVGRAPTTSTMGSIIAAVQVQEAIKIGQGDVAPETGGKRIVFNCLENDFYTTRGARRDDCTAHRRLGAVQKHPEWEAATTTPLDMIEQARRDFGGEAYVRLGRDVAVGIEWSTGVQELDRGQLSVTESQARNSAGELGKPQFINRVLATDPHAHWTLDRLAIPAWHIVEVRTEEAPYFYELSGDAF